MATGRMTLPHAERESSRGTPSMRRHLFVRASGGRGASFPCLDCNRRASPPLTTSSQCRGCRSRWSGSTTRPSGTAVSSRVALVDEHGAAAGDESCPMRHVGYTISGSFHVVMDDGQTLEIQPGSVFEIPAGHDKWVVGDDVLGMHRIGRDRRAMQAVVSDAGTRMPRHGDVHRHRGINHDLERIGDKAWHALLLAHNARIREELEHPIGARSEDDGRRVPGDLRQRDAGGRCSGVDERVLPRAMDLQIRVGVHTGEVELSAATRGDRGSRGGSDDLALAVPDEVSSLLDERAARRLRVRLEDAGDARIEGPAGETAGVPA